MSESIELARERVLEQLLDEIEGAAASAQTGWGAVDVYAPHELTARAVRAAFDVLLRDPARLTTLLGYEVLTRNTR